MTDLRKRHDETDDEYTERIVDQNIDWLDDLATTSGVQAAYDIAKVNRDVVGRWGEKFIAKHGLTDANITLVAKRQSAQVAFEKAQLEYSKVTGSDSINAFLANGGIEPYRELCAATAALAAHAQSGAEVSPIAKGDAFAQLERGLTAFCKAKGIQKVWTEGLEKFRNTDEGRALSDNYNAAT